MSKWSFDLAAIRLGVQVIPFDEGFLVDTLNKQHPEISSPAAKMLNLDVKGINGFHYWTFNPNVPIVSIRRAEQSKFDILHSQVHELAHVVMQHSNVWLQVSQRLFVECEIAAETVSAILLLELEPQAVNECENIMKQIAVWAEVRESRPKDFVEDLAGLQMLSITGIEQAADKIKRAGLE